MRHYRQQHISNRNTGNVGCVRHIQERGDSTFCFNVELCGPVRVPTACRAILGFWFARQALYEKMRPHAFGIG